MQIILIEIIDLIALITIIIKLAPDCLTPMQISLPTDRLAPSAILNIIIYELALKSYHF